MSPLTRVLDPYEEGPMQTVPFTALPNIARTGVDLTLHGQRGSVIAVVSFTPDEVRELQRQLGAAMDQLRPVVRP